MKFKKIVIYLLITIIMLLTCSSVKAATNYKVELISNNTTIQQGEQIEITIKVKDIVDIDGGIAGLSAKLEYDTRKLEKVGEGQGLNGFMLVEGNTIELAKYPGVTTETEIAKFTFKAKSAGEAQIKLTEIEVANGTDTFELGQGVTKKITITSTNAPTEQLSSNNNLSNLSIDGAPISDFNKDTLKYTLTPVENSKTSIEIKAEPEDTKAKVEGTGKKDLSVGENSFSIVVTAEDGTQKKYEVNIERKAGDTNKEDDSNKNDNNSNNGNNNGENNKKDDSTSPEDIPHAGVKTYILLGVIVAVIIFALISYRKSKNLSGI